MDMSLTELEERAYEFAKKAHGDQKRKYTEEPYIHHPVAVAGKIKILGLAENMVCAALLHDTLEDTETTESQLRKEFGPDITSLVV